MYFVLNDEKYKELDDLIFNLNKEISNIQTIDIKIEWYWDFNGNDVIDTMNGKLLDTYYFEMALKSY